MPIDFAKLTAKQVLDLPKTQTVFFFPVGPLEDHGPHLPMGLDLSEADQLCRMAAERIEHDKPGWTGIIMPAAPLGVSSNTSALAMTVRSYVLRDWLVDSCRSLVRAGFRHFVCFSGQLGPRQLTAIEEAGKLVMWQGPITKLRALFARPESVLKTPATFASASSALTQANDLKKSPLWSDPVEHGAKRDTSVALALGWMEGQSLTPATVSALGLTAHPRRGTHWKRGWELVTRKRHGYWGTTNPAEATAEAGQATLQSSFEEIYPKLRAVWEGSNPNLLFRSYYSILPPNKSFFKSWMIGIMVFGVILAWLYLALMTSLPS